MARSSLRLRLRVAGPVVYALLLVFALVHIPYGLRKLGLLKPNPCKTTKLPRLIREMHFAAELAQREGRIMSDLGNPLNRYQ